MKIVLAIDPKQPHAWYRNALLAAGALPGEVEVVQPGDPLPGEFDGLLLSGGIDVDPARYGEEALNASVETNRGRDELDFALLARAGEIGAAVFGICRGLQVVNVAFGGTLWQDLPAQRPRGVPHSFPRKDHDPGHPAHAVRAARGVSREVPFAATIEAADGMSVNSRHHQAVKDLAPGLVPLAASPDDLVEAFARDGEPFLAAVQWHPENLVDRADQRALFEEFLTAARRRAERRPNPGNHVPRPETSAVAPPARPEGAAGCAAGNDIAPRGIEGPGGRAAPPDRRSAGGPETA